LKGINVEKRVGERGIGEIRGIRGIGEIGVIRGIRGRGIKSGFTFRKFFPIFRSK